MSSHTSLEDVHGWPLISAVTSAVTLLTVGLAMTLLLLGWSQFWIVFVIGFAFVLPAATHLANWYDAEAESGGRTEDGRDGQQAALETLRERYATGEIGEAEFERRVERLIGTESVADAETFYRESDSDASDELTAPERN